MIHLDTGFLIRALVPESGENRTLRAWIGRGESLAMSAIAWAEVLCGPLEEAHADLAARVVPGVVPFAAADARVAARLFNETGRSRGSFVDCMIAAAVLRAGASLATTNPSDFRRFEPAGLSLAV